MDRVKFYSIDDMSVVPNLEKSFSVLKDLDVSYSNYGINDVIEFFNIIKFVKSGLYLKSWSETEKETNVSKSKQLPGIICRYFNEKVIKNFTTSFEQVEFEYKRDFWEILTQYNFYLSIKKEEFETLLLNCQPYIAFLFEHKPLVKRFDIQLRKYLLSNPKNAEFLLDYFEVDNLVVKNFYMPSSLNIADKEKLIEQYIDDPDVNSNYLRIIVTLQDRKDMLCIDDMIRLKAKNKIEYLYDQTSNMYFSVKKDFRVAFRNQKAKKLIKQSSDSIELTYSLDWLKEHKDYESLLINFVELFEYVDSQMRVTLVSKFHEQEVLERYIGLRAKNAYVTSLVYKKKSIISDLQFHVYYNQLKSLDVRVEDIIEWYFHEYVSTIFFTKNYKFNKPSLDSTYFEKCRSILPEIDSILKQYEQIVKYKEINQDLLQISSKHLLLKDCSSLSETKYIYKNKENDKIEKVFYYLFSDQCPLTYVERIKKTYLRFWELIVNEKISMSDYPEYFHNDIKWLIKNGILIERDNTLEFYNSKRILIYIELFYNEVLNYSKYPLDFQEEINIMLDENLLFKTSTLLSQPEQDYFNYHLNKSSFSNSLDLRNSYLHGTQTQHSKDDPIHEHNYMVFLKLLILIILKINDELMLGVAHNLIKKQ